MPNPTLTPRTLALSDEERFAVYQSVAAEMRQAGACLTDARNMEGRLGAVLEDLTRLEGAKLEEIVPAARLPEIRTTLKNVADQVRTITTTLQTMVDAGG